MEIFSNISMLLGGSWATGINMYLSIAGLGLAGKFNWIQLPGNLEVISNPVVIVIAGILYLIDFVTDKIPAVDSLMDSIYTFIKPASAVAMSYMATSGVGPEMQVPLALLGGAVAMDSHLTKASARAAINTSPEPVTNSIASVTEDGLVIGMLMLVSKHPVIAGILVIIFIVFSVWFMSKMFKYVKKIFSKIKKIFTRT